MLNWEGYVAEGTISNIFFIKDGVLVTPSLETGILKGVTRTLVLDLAGKEGIQTREGLIQPAELMAADECFITNTTVEIMPVTKVNDKPVGSGQPGPITAQLLKAYKNEVQQCLKTQAG
jgi:branched-subunit amino acid aminotransferase/4-amino-4-deoxychorismate lyase